MKTLAELFQTLNKHRMVHDDYYNMNEFLLSLEMLSDESIETEDYLITPFYFSNGKIMELYWLELSIVTDSKLSFEDWLLKSAGRQDINEIPFNIVQFRKECYIGCGRNSKTIHVARLKAYIQFLLSYTDLQSEIKKGFGSFDGKNLFFQVY